MPYHVYDSWIAGFLKKRNNPLVLEIGVDTGSMLVKIAKNMDQKPFRYLGLDIRISPKLSARLNELQLCEHQHAECQKTNSLEWLPSCQEQFDVILIDGDHNYYTVSRELSFLDALLKSDGVCICDDYGGRWSERDLFYAERYSDIKIATARVQTDKHGVRPAIDEFLESNPGWEKKKIRDGEAVMLLREETAKQLGL